MPSVAWDDAHRKLIRNTIGKRLSESTLLQLEHIAQTRNLDPLCGELIAYEQGGKGVFITTIGGMTKLCAELLDGIDATFYDKDGNGHPVWLPDTPPAACAVTVYRRGCQRPFTNACRFADYRGSGQPWKAMPSTMIRKCALAGALRLAFADLLAGLYAQEEMEQAGFTAQDQQQQQAPAPTAAKPAGKVRPRTPLQQEAPSDTGAAGIDAAAESLAAFTHGTVVEQVREEVEEPQGLPQHSYGQGLELTQRLYDRCRELGMTGTGLSTMLGQLGASDGLASLPPKVQQTVLMKLDPSKVLAFNSGQRTA